MEFRERRLLFSCNHMFGQGSPISVSAINPNRHLLRISLALLLMLVSFCRIALCDSPEGSRVRWTWGGDMDLAVRGRIEFPVDTKLSNLRILGISSEQAGRIYIRGSSVHVDLARGSRFGGFDVDIEADLEKEIRVKLVAESKPGGNDSSLEFGFPLKSLGQEPVDRHFGELPYRFFVERAPGDAIKFLCKKNSLVFEPDEPLEFSLKVGELTTVDYTTRKQLRARLFSDPPVHASKSSKPRKLIWSHKLDVQSERQLRRFVYDVEMEPGSYTLEVDLFDPSPLLFGQARVHAKRSIQFVVVDRSSQHLSLTAKNGKVVYENTAGRPTDWTPRLSKIGSTARDLIRSMRFNGRISKRHFELEPASWSVFPLSVGEAQRPFLFEVDLTAEEESDLDFLLLDRTDENQVLNEICNTSLKKISMKTGEEDRLQKRRVHRFLSWTSSRTPVLLVNHRKGKSNVKVHRIRVIGIEKEAFNYVFATSQNRRLFALTSIEDIKKTYCVSGIREGNGIPLDDWRGFQTGAYRAIQSLKLGNYQGLVLDVNRNGGSVYPSNLLTTNPSLDTGRFARTGRDPVDKDVLELWFRQFDVAHLTLLPRVELPEYVASLESLKHELDEQQFRELFVTDAFGNPLQTYNLLNPRVQDAIRKMVMELVNRYSHHKSFGGISLRLGANRQLMFPGEMTGFNQSIVQQYYKDHPTQLASSNQADRKQMQIPLESRNEFYAWRAKKVSEFLAELNQLVSDRSGKRMIVDSSTLMDQFHDSELSVAYPSLRSIENSPSKLIVSGVDQKLLSESSVVQPVNSLQIVSETLADRRSEYYCEQQQALSPEGSGLIVQRRVVQKNSQRLSLNGESSVDGLPARLDYQVGLQNSNQEFRRVLTRELASKDVLLLVDSALPVQRFLAGRSKRIWQTYTRLPNTAFTSVTTNNLSPVVVRNATVGSTSYIYFVNQSPWPSRLTIEFESPLGNFRNLSGEFFKQLKKTEKGGELIVDLDAYDLIAGFCDLKELKIKSVKYSLPDKLKEELLQQKEQLLAQIRFLHTPPSMMDGHNPGFENVDQQGMPAGWTFSSKSSFQLQSILATESTNTKLSSLIRQQTATDRKQPVANQKILRLTNRVDENWGWIRSGSIQSTQSGRVSLVVAMRNVQGNPNVRLSIEGKSGGREYYRFGSFSSLEKEPASKIENEWKVFAVHFNDVPTDIAGLRVGLDMIGSGAIEIDMVQVFDRWFDKNDQEALTKIVTLAAHQISEGEFLQAHRLLNSYWPVFVRTYNQSSKKTSESRRDQPGE